MLFLPKLSLASYFWIGINRRPLTDLLVATNSCNYTGIRKISNFAVHRDHIIKSKIKRVVTYTCRYSSGYLIPELSYSTVVLYIGIMKVRGFWSQIITMKPA